MSDLGEDKEDSDGSTPGVHRDQVAGGEGVQVPGRQEPHHQAGQGEEGEDDVEDGGAAGEAAGGAGEHQHALASAVDGPHHHEERVEVPLQPQVPAQPGEGEALAVPADLAQPVEQNCQEAVQHQLGQQTETGQPATSSFSSSSFSWLDGRLRPETSTSTSSFCLSLAWELRPWAPLNSKVSQPAIENLTPEEVGK